MPARLDEGLDRLAKDIGDLRDVMASSRGIYGGASTITVNAGGVGVWVSVTCCLMMLVGGLIAGLWMVSDRAEIRAQLRERRDGENAIRAYINTGILKPQNDKDKSDAE